MPSDLNLKKSWNPKLMKNREKVWLKEQEVIQEYRKIKEREKEIKEASSKNELLLLNGRSKDDSSTNKGGFTTTSWMYDGSENNLNSGGSGNGNEDYLLGKRSLNGLIESKSLSTDDKGKLNEAIGIEKAVETNKDEKEEELDKQDPMYEFRMQQRRIQQLELQDKQRRKESSRSHHSSRHSHSHHSRSHRSRKSHRRHNVDK